MNANAQHPQPELSDEELAYLAQAALTWNSALAPGTVTASAAAGWLTLSGKVRWHYQRQDAVECVRHLQGLAGISNDIQLCPGEPASKARPEVVEGVDEGIAHVIHVGHPLVP